MQAWKEAPPLRPLERMRKREKAECPVTIKHAWAPFFFTDAVCSAGLGFDRTPKQAQVEQGVQTSL